MNHRTHLIPAFKMSFQSLLNMLTNLFSAATPHMVTCQQPLALTMGALDASRRLYSPGASSAHPHKASAPSPAPPPIPLFSPLHPPQSPPDTVAANYDA